MSRLSAKLIDLYRVATWPIRKWGYSQMKRSGTVPVYSIFYHRVADDNLNPWTIRCDKFQNQIDWMQDNFDIVDLQECQRRIDSGYNVRPTLSITFDDGYSENCDFALPMLVERRIPVTYFVTTHHTFNQRPFQHDVERTAPLTTNTIESLRALDLAGVEIAAHTRNHPDLAKVNSQEQLWDEVIKASRELGELIGRDVRYFAFPYGQYCNLNPRVFQLLREEGFLGVCSAYGGWNNIGGDSFHIQRIHGDPSISRMMNWLTYDPRIANVERYDYEKALIEWEAEAEKVAAAKHETAVGEPVVCENVDATQAEGASESAELPLFPEVSIQDPNLPAVKD